MLSEQLYRHPCPGNLAGREAIWCLYYMAHVWNTSPLVMKLARKVPAVKQTSISCHFHQIPVCIPVGEHPCAPSPGGAQTQQPHNCTLCPLILLSSWPLFFREIFPREEGRGARENGFIISKLVQIQWPVQQGGPWPHHRGSAICHPKLLLPPIDSAQSALSAFTASHTSAV